MSNPPHARSRFFVPREAALDVLSERTSPRLALTLPDLGPGAYFAALVVSANLIAFRLLLDRSPQRAD